MSWQDCISLDRLKPGCLIMMKERWPCKVTVVQNAGGNVHVTGKEIFTNKQYEETFVTGDTVRVAPATKKELQCLSYDDDGRLQILDESGDLKEDLSIPTESHLSDVGQNIRRIIDAATKECLVTILACGNKQQVVVAREGSSM